MKKKVWLDVYLGEFEEDEIRELEEDVVGEKVEVSSADFIHQCLDGWLTVAGLTTGELT